MARWVIGRPGSPEDEYASTNFSAWIQPVDQTARMTFDTTFTDNPPRIRNSASVGEQVADPPVPPEMYPADISELATELMSGFNGVTAGGLDATFSHSPWTLSTGTAEGGDDDPFYYSHAYSGSRGGTAVMPHANTQDLMWRDDWRTSWPDNAIGYEVETVDVTFMEAEVPVPGAFPLADPVSLALSVSLQTATGVGTNGGLIEGLLTRVVVNSKWGAGDLVYFFDGLFFVELIGTHPGVLSDVVEFGAVEHPVIPSGTEAAPSVYEFTVDDFSAAPPNTGMFGLYVGMTGDGLTGGSTAVQVEVGENGGVSTSDGLNYSGVYTIRPPRFRWIYARAPYRRTFPNDAVAEMGRRAWPPTKAAQRGRRTSGGYR